MSHHYETPRERDQQIRKSMEALGLGATKRYPNGVINDLDEGEIKFAIGSDPERELVFINFGKSIDFLGMNPQDAIGMAQLLIQHARRVAKSPVNVQLH